MFLEQNQISTQLDIKDPFLMIDEIKIDLNQKKAKSSKILNKNDWFFACHMPTSPVMPATLQMEGMLQTLVLLIYNCSEKKISKSFIVDAQTKFYTKVFKQPMINYYAELIYSKRGIYKGNVVGKFSNEKICEGQFTYASPELMNIPNLKKISN